MTLALSAAIGAAPDPSKDPESVELTGADLDRIREIMVSHAPVLAASPGIKHADARRDGDTLYATVYFYPYQEMNGVGRALKAHCERSAAVGSWSCPRGELRTYLTVPGQDFRVRVIGQIDYETAIALIDATRAARPDRSASGTPIDTAGIMVGYGSDPALRRMSVGWGDREGHGLATVEAELMPESNPRLAENWRVLAVHDGP